jgi:hypothetical protein
MSEGRGRREEGKGRGKSLTVAVKAVLFPLPTSLFPPLMWS